ncbi:uncharacterized protein EV420DRAFT_1568219, partial [Desarmillaria tabescens]
PVLIMHRTTSAFSSSTRLPTMLSLGFKTQMVAMVVQHILDLNDNRFSDAVIRQFAGNVCALSVQKFSCNVIEKLIADGWLVCQ